MKRDMDIVRNLLLSSRGTTSGEYCETDVLPVIKARLQFVQIGVQMLDADLVVGADLKAFQQAPNGLNIVRVHVSFHPLVRAGF